MSVSRAIILVLGVAYPAYCSYKSLKKRRMENNVKWLTYWLSFAVFKITEFFADFLLIGWMPFYTTAKVLFIMWLLSPITDGSKLFYHKVLRPFLDNRERQIDDYFSNMILRVMARLMPTTIMISREIGERYSRTLRPIEAQLMAPSEAAKQQSKLHYYKYESSNFSPTYSTTSLPSRSSKSEVDLPRRKSHEQFSKKQSGSSKDKTEQTSDDIKKMLKVNFCDKNLEPNKFNIDEVYIFFQ